jgi:hypothetical protein
VSCRPDGASWVGEVMPGDAKLVQEHVLVFGIMALRSGMDCGDPHVLLRGQTCGQTCGHGRLLCLFERSRESSVGKQIA